MHTISSDLIQELIFIAALLEKKGFVNSYEGNISVIDRGEGLLYITPTGTRKLTLTEPLIAVLDLQGNQIAGAGRPSSEYRLHLAAMKLRPDINAVVHCHSPYLTAYAMCGKSIVTKCHEEFLYINDIPCIPHGKAGTEEIFVGLDAVIADHDVMLLANHGALCLGRDLDRACQMAEAMENTVCAYTIAQQIGHPQPIPNFDALYEKIKGRPCTFDC